MNNRARILRILADGPSTSSEIACTLYMSRRLISATLQQMHERGHVARSGTEVRLREDDDTTVYIYALPEHASALAH